GAVEYNAISGVRSILINATTGEVIDSPQPSLATRFFREAHFYFFAYPYNAVLTGIFSALACLSVLSGIYLNVNYWGTKLRIRNRHLETSKS
ncbi:MAG: PepSY domain-containing protein, partial [Acidobacteriota bacterium]|nr:PepSY domain-containing protein [Acidobacteriota bacterium]